MYNQHIHIINTRTKFFLDYEKIKWGLNFMKKKIILIGIILLLLCLTINAISASTNNTFLSSKDNNQVLEQSADNTVLKEYKKFTLTYKNFQNGERAQLKRGSKIVISEKDVIDAKKTAKKVIIKKDPNIKVEVFTPYKRTVKEKVYKTVKVKSVKKFTCWIGTKKSIKLDNNYLKNYYKYQRKGYKIDTGKWVKTNRDTWKCIFTATKVKKINKWTGKYKTSKFIDYKMKTLKGVKIKICADGTVTVGPDVKGYGGYMYQMGYALPGLCTVGKGTYI